MNKENIIISLCIIILLLFISQYVLIYFAYRKLDNVYNTDIQPLISRIQTNLSTLSSIQNNLSSLDGVRNVLNKTIPKVSKLL